jgi:uncharacterized protein YeaO (DUF488 family)
VLSTASSPFRGGGRLGGMIQLRRVYEPPLPTDGRRVLVDRLWPRGLTKARARVDNWERDLAPSTGLRMWYGHEPSKFPRFRERYRMELLQQREALATLAIETERETVTLLCAASDLARSNAAVLKDVLEEVLDAGPSPATDERTRPPSRKRSPPARTRRR